MKLHLAGTLAATVTLLAITEVGTASAQGGMPGRIRERTVQSVEEKVQELDRSAGRPPSTNEVTTPPHPAEGASLATPVAVSGAGPLRPGEGAWANYDFVPGDRPLFVDDYSADRVVNFPRRLEFIEGTMDIVEWQGSRWLRATSKARFSVPLSETLPERFTMEFDYVGLSKYELKVRFHGPNWQTEEEVHIGAWGWGVSGSTVSAITRPRDADGIENRVVRVRVMADGSYVKVYVDGERVANVPNANLGRADRVWFEIPTSEDTPALVGDIRVMASEIELYDSLIEAGRVATQGVLFGGGSDRIRPESTPTLREIADLLTSTPTYASPSRATPTTSGPSSSTRRSPSSGRPRSGRR
jgi:OmpA-OmpF porin, OOP family